MHTVRYTIPKKCKKILPGEEFGLRFWSVNLCYTSEQMCQIYTCFGPREFQDMRSLALPLHYRSCQIHVYCCKIILLKINHWKLHSCFEALPKPFGICGKLY